MADSPRADRNQREKNVVWKPIFPWKEWVVREFIERHEIPYPRLGDGGWEKAGWVICPFICGWEVKQAIRNRARWSGLYKVCEHIVTKWRLSGKSHGGDSREQTAGK